MKTAAKCLILVFLASIIIKFLLASVIIVPTIYGDEYSYLKLARSLFIDKQYLTDKNNYQPAYPALISPLYLLKDMELIYLLMKLVNAILLSLIIFPSYLILKEFLNPKKAMIISALISFLPSHTIFANYIMAENLFYPLFLFAFLAFYKMATTNELKWAALAAICTAIGYLTKGSGLTLLPLGILSLFLGSYLTRKIELKKILSYFIITAILVAPWLLFQSSMQSGASEVVLGRVANDATAIERHSDYIGTFISWIFLYLGHFAIGSAVIFFLYTITLVVSKKLEKNLRILSVLGAMSILFFLMIGANHAAGGPSTVENPFPWISERPIGRYVDAVLPLFFILGTIAWEKRMKIQKSYIILTSLTLFFASQLTIFLLAPVNNITTAHLGILKYALEYVLFHKTSFTPIFNVTSLAFFSLLFLVAPFLIVFFLRKKKFVKLFPALMIFFLLVSGANIAMAKYREQEWLSNDQIKMSLYINRNIKEHASYLVDEGSCTIEPEKESLCQKDNDYSPAGVFINEKVIIGEVQENYEGYILSTRNLPYPVERQEGKIKLYKKEN